MHPRRLESRILKAMTRASHEFGLLAEGDRVMVALSGGKDSYGLLWGLQRLRAAAPFDFELFAYHLDQGQPGHDFTPLENHLKNLGVDYEIEYQDTYTRVIELTEPGKIYCSACSRFRRAILYKAAARHGCNKVALGHHSDDLIETLLLSVLYAGQIKSMPPKLQSSSGPQQLIRPLVYVPEVELTELAQQQEFPIMPCQLCGTQDTKRQFIKGLINDLSRDQPHIRGNILHSLSNVVPTHLMDHALNPGLASVDTDDDDDGCGIGAPPPSTSVLPLLS